MRAFVITYRDGQPRICERKCRMEGGAICWPGPPALWPNRKSVFRRRCDAVAYLAEKEKP